jgi:hypothetical protein
LQELVEGASTGLGLRREACIVEEPLSTVSFEWHLHQRVESHVSSLAQSAKAKLLAMGAVGLWGPSGDTARTLHEDRELRKVRSTDENSEKSVA